jgi:heme exporter protein C
MRGKSLRNLSLASAAALAAAFALVFLYAPLDADQGLIQKIFYVHVPLAIVSLSGFVAAAIMAVRYLRTGDASWDRRSYVAIHLSLVFAVGVLVTGSIWRVPPGATGGCGASRRSSRS